MEGVLKLFNSDSLKRYHDYHEGFYDCLEDKVMAAWASEEYVAGWGEARDSRGIFEKAGFTQFRRATFP